MKTAVWICALVLLTTSLSAEVMRPRVSIGVGFGDRGFHGHGHRHYGHGYGHGPRRLPAYGWHGGYRYAPVYGYGYYPAPIYRSSVVYDYGYSPARTPGYAANGLFWGALAGAIVGHNSGDLRNSAWRGAAIGAGAGYLLGAIADQRTERDDEASRAPSVQAQPAVTPSVTASVPAASNPAPVRATTSMSAANELFGR